MWWLPVYSYLPTLQKLCCWIRSFPKSPLWISTTKLTVYAKTYTFQGEQTKVLYSGNFTLKICRIYALKAANTEVHSTYILNQSHYKTNLWSVLVYILCKKCTFLSSCVRRFTTVQIIPFIILDAHASCGTIKCEYWKA